MKKIEKAEKLLEEFLAKRQENYVPLNEVIDYLVQNGINKRYAYNIIVTLSANNKIYTVTGSNRRIYIVKHPEAYNTVDFIKNAKDPAYLTYAFINSLLSLYNGNYVDTKEIYRLMKKTYNIKYSKWFTILRIALTQAGYIEEYGNHSRKYIKPTQKFFNEYGISFTYDKAIKLYSAIRPYLTKIFAIRRGSIKKEEEEKL